MTTQTLETLYTPYTLDNYNLFTFESEIESEIYNYNDENKTNLGYDDFSWEYRTKEYIKALTDNLITLLNDNITDGVIKKITLDGEPISPRQYNYITDYAFLTFEYDQKKLYQYIKDNSEHYEKNKIKSAPGFTWLADEKEDDATQLAYYLDTVSKGLYTPGTYELDQFEQVPAYEYITMQV